MTAASRIENVTVAEVMKAAGLTHGAFYAHFGSKEEIQRRKSLLWPESEPISIERFIRPARSAAVYGRIPAMNSAGPVA